MRSWVQVVTKVVKTEKTVSYQRQDFENGLATLPKHDRFDEEADEQREDFVNVMLSLSVDEATVIYSCLCDTGRRGAGALSKEIAVAIGKAEAKQAEAEGNSDVQHPELNVLKQTQSYKSAETR